MARYYTLCRESGRRDLLIDLQNDYYELIEEIRASGESQDFNPEDLSDEDPSVREAAQHELRRGSMGMISRIRVVFEFTNSEGLLTKKLFHDLGKVEHFLLWDRAYAREVKGKQKKPDWSKDGLCSYHKEITLGVAIFRGQEFKGFRKDHVRKYYGEESE